MATHRPQSAAGVIRTIVGRFARQVPPDIAQIVSITEVEVSPDVSHATVYVTALRGVEAAIAWMLKHAKRELKPIIARELNIYTVPTLRFVADDRPQKTERLEQLLR
jgi:ribosome-binding factor A